jgi:DNA mismatch repair protein MutL
MEEPPANPAQQELPLGVARAQLHETYIVAQTADGIVIVDQHAAHERLVYERMKHAMENGGVARQPLLIPEVVSLDPAEVERVVSCAQNFAQLGLILEAFGPDAVIVREVPAALGQIETASLIRDLADELAESGAALSLRERLEHVAGTLARSGRVFPVEHCRALHVDRLAVARGGTELPFGHAIHADLIERGIAARLGHRNVLNVAVRADGKGDLGPAFRQLGDGIMRAGR